MVVVVRVLKRKVLPIYLNEKARDFLAAIPQEDHRSMSDERYSNFLEEDGWKLVSVVSVFHTQEFDKEMWFRKD